MGMVNAYKKGKLKGASPAVRKAAKGMTSQAAHDFAATKHEGLPEKTEKAGAADFPTGQLPRVRRQTKQAAETDLAQDPSGKYYGDYTNKPMLHVGRYGNPGKPMLVTTKAQWNRAFLTKLLSAAAQNAPGGMLLNRGVVAIKKPRLWGLLGYKPDFVEDYDVLDRNTTPEQLQAYAQNLLDNQYVGSSVPGSARYMSMYRKANPQPDPSQIILEDPKVKKQTKQAKASQFAMGLKEEAEHPVSMQVRRTIVKQHLKEDPMYYTKIKTVLEKREKGETGNSKQAALATGKEAKAKKAFEKWKATRDSQAFVEFLPRAGTTYTGGLDTPSRVSSTLSTKKEKAKEMTNMQKKAILLPAGIGAVIGGSVDDEDRLRGALRGAGMGITTDAGAALGALGGGIGGGLGGAALGGIGGAGIGALLALLGRNPKAVSELANAGATVGGIGGAGLGLLGGGIYGGVKGFQFGKRHLWDRGKERRVRGKEEKSGSVRQNSTKLLKRALVKSAAANRANRGLIKAAFKLSDINWYDPAVRTALGIAGGGAAGLAMNQFRDKKDRGMGLPLLTAALGGAGAYGIPELIKAYGGGAAPPAAPSGAMAAAMVGVKPPPATQPASKNTPATQPASKSDNPPGTGVLKPTAARVPTTDIERKALQLSDLILSGKIQLNPALPGLGGGPLPPREQAIPQFGGAPNLGFNEMTGQFSLPPAPTFNQASALGKPTSFNSARNPELGFNEMTGQFNTHPDETWVNQSQLPPIRFNR